MEVILKDNKTEEIVEQFEVDFRNFCRNEYIKTNKYLFYIKKIVFDTTCNTCLVFGTVRQEYEND